MTPGRTLGGLSPSHKLLFYNPLDKTTKNGLEVFKVECDPLSRFVSSLPLSDFRFTMSLSHDVPLAASLGHCLYVLGSVQRTGEKLLLQYNTMEGMTRQQLFFFKINTRVIEHCLSLPKDSWLELLPTLTRADADLPALYFLGATDRLLVVGGNNTETVITSFCPHTKKWGQVCKVLQP